MARSRSAETRHAIGRISRICSLGLGAHAAMPALVCALQELIPSSNSGFFLAGPRLELVDSYLEGPFVEVLPLYLREYYNRRECAFAYTFREMMQRHVERAAGEGFARFLKVGWASFLRGDYYNVIFRPAGIAQACCVKLVEGGRPLGQLMIFRTEREPAFEARDFALLESLQGFIAHALHKGPNFDDFAATDDRALIILDRDGHLLQVSPTAHRLMLMAFVPHWAPDAAGHMRFERRLELASLCQTLIATCAEDRAATPPVLHRRNTWGEFVLRAYWLDAVDPAEPGRFIAISIERREPLALRLLRKIEALPLTRREKELCLLLARGHDTASAARAMGVSESTVVTHRRSIYEKLALESRTALINRLNSN